jgi:hypothetical protein
MCWNFGGNVRVNATRSTCICDGGKRGYCGSAPTFHKTSYKRVERPNESSSTHLTIEVYYNLLTILLTRACVMITIAGAALIAKGR